jgi:putative nucleotidyltransferase with HDIG domain
MRITTKSYVFATAAITPVAVSLLAYSRPSVTRAELTAIAFFSALAVIAEMLAFVLSQKARGSIAFIPYLAAVLLAPSWTAVVAVMAVKLAMELVARRVTLLQACFNTCSHGLTLACAIGVYQYLGGVGFLEGGKTTLIAITESFGVPATAAFATSFLINTLLACGVISLDTGERFFSILRSSSLPTIGADLLTTPIVFVFSWLYTGFGAMAAAAAWVPIVGIRHLNRVQLELEHTNEELLQLMVKSIEARDPYTSGHSRRVSTYAVAIARALQLSEREVRKVATAALLHDVGKIYEKYAPILSNPGRLSPSEWSTMQEHPIDGANLVATISRMRDIVPAVRHHHENWDGTGYPDKIAGDGIPLASRIIMFADTIDAMTSERPYRGPLSEAEVRAEILRGRGRQFDPAITDRLLAAGVWKTLFAAEKSSTSRGLSLVGNRETA